MAEAVEVFGGWTDTEIHTFLRREARFLKIGMTDMDAEKLAEQMLYRDRPDEGDDRRICIECKGYNLKRRVCDFAARMGLRAGMEPVATILWRCDGFVLRGAA
jgi:hypothetical protein